MNFSDKREQKSSKYFNQSAKQSSLLFIALIKIFQTNEIWLVKNFSAECKKNLERSEKFLIHKFI
jgi:hypothetical protein